MRWLGSGPWVAIVMVLGCAAAPYDRAQYTLGSVAGVLYSNSLVVTGQVTPRKSPAGLEVVYPLLFHNRGNEAARLGLTQVTAELNSEPGRVVVRCAEHGFLPSAALDLPPGERLRVDCRLTLTAQGLTDARASDSEILLSVPVLSASQVRSAIFGFRLKLEDAS